MTIFRRTPTPCTTYPIYDIDKTDPSQWMLVEVGRTPKSIGHKGRLKHLVVKIKNMRPGWHRQLGRLAAVRLVEPYNWTPGYFISVRPPKPRGGVGMRPYLVTLGELALPLAVLLLVVLYITGVVIGWNGFAGEENKVNGRRGV